MKGRSTNLSDWNTKMYFELIGDREEVKVDENSEDPNDLRYMQEANLQI